MQLPLICLAGRDKHNSQPLLSLKKNGKKGGETLESVVDHDASFLAARSVTADGQVPTPELQPKLLIGAPLFSLTFPWSIALDAAAPRVSSGDGPGPVACRQ